MAQHVLQAHLPTVWQNQAILPTNKPRASSQDLLLKIIEVSSSCVPTLVQKNDFHTMEMCSARTRHKMQLLSVMVFLGA